MYGVSASVVSHHLRCCLRHDCGRRHLRLHHHPRPRSHPERVEYTNPRGVRIILPPLPPLPQIPGSLGPVRFQGSPFVTPIPRGRAGAARLFRLYFFFDVFLSLFKYEH